MNLSTQFEPSHYTQGEPFMREKSQLFAREWLPVCAPSQLGQPGDYVGHVIGGWPIAAVRQANQVRLFRNTCRHQNMMVLDKPAGSCSIIQCRYHGWQYQLDGTFAAAPPLVAPPADASGDATNLTGLATHHVGHLLLGHLQLHAQPPKVNQAVADALIEPPATVSTVDIGCNWKVFVEHALAHDLPFQWPLLAVRPMAQCTQVLQIVPRSFLRTRVVNYVITPVEAAPSAVEQAAAALERDRVACEALQARYAEGEFDALSGGDDERAQRIREFRRRVLEALAAD